MLETIFSLNQLAEDARITEVSLCRSLCILMLITIQPSLMNFCVTDGESVVATRYISSRHDEAASLVCCEHCHIVICWPACSGIRPAQHSASTPKAATTKCPKPTSEKISLWYFFICNFYTNHLTLFTDCQRTTDFRKRWPLITAVCIFVNAAFVSWLDGNQD